MSFIYKSVKEYRNEYNVIASFYKTVDGNDARLFADVVRKTHINSPIDAYIVMINPGSCKVSPQMPNDEITESEFYCYYDAQYAVSDPAQKCIMAFMDICKLNKVRILNLIDYQSGDYKAAVKAANKNMLKESIFSDERIKIREKLMTENAVVIAAWGTGREFLPFKEQAVKNLKSYDIIGIPAKNNKTKYDFEYIKPQTYKEQIERIMKLSECFNAYRETKNPVL